MSPQNDMTLPVVSCHSKSLEDCKLKSVTKSLEDCKVNSVTI